MVGLPGRPIAGAVAKEVPGSGGGGLSISIIPVMRSRRRDSMRAFTDSEFDMDQALEVMTPRPGYNQPTSLYLASRGYTIRFDDPKHFRLWPDLFGIPEDVVCLAHALGGDMPRDRAGGTVSAPGGWLLEWIRAVPVGGDLHRVGPRFMLWLLDVDILGTAGTYPEVVDVRKLLERSLSGEHVMDEQWFEVRAVAQDAGRSEPACLVAACVAAGNPVSAASAAAVVVESGVFRTAAPVARASFYSKAADQLLELLMDCDIESKGTSGRGRKHLSKDTSLSSAAAG